MTATPRADAIAVINRVLVESHPDYPAEHEKLVKVIRKVHRSGALDVYFDRAADALRERYEEGVDWANMDADSPKFRFEVAHMVTDMLYNTS